METKAFILKNEGGFHLRPAAQFSKAMTGFEADVIIKHGDKLFNGKSAVSLLSAQLEKGSLITVECRGKDEKTAIKEAEAIIEANN